MQQRGFTLLELMVAMAIFAVLAIAGWQVFDSVNRARERAQFHADQLATLQYAYLQIQQDMTQIVPYHSLMVQDSNNRLNNKLNSDENNGRPSTGSNSAIIIAEPFMRLEGDQLSFIRFADPDPRYKVSPSLQRVAYIFTEEQLIRRQYVDINSGETGISLDSVLLKGVTAGRWQAFLPKISATFPNDNSDGQSNNVVAQSEGSVDKPLLLLPKGVGVGFTYQELPITWRWALSPQAISLDYYSHSGKNANNSNQNGNNSNGNTNGSANSDNNSKEGSGNEDNLSSKNTSESLGF